MRAEATFKRNVQILKMLWRSPFYLRKAQITMQGAKETIARVRSSTALEVSVKDVSGENGLKRAGFAPIKSDI